MVLKKKLVIKWLMIILRKQLLTRLNFNGKLLEKLLLILTKKKLELLRQKS
jgi:hypothetical protein